MCCTFSLLNAILEMALTSIHPGLFSKTKITALRPGYSWDMPQGYIEGRKRDHID